MSALAASLAVLVCAAADGGLETTRAGTQGPVLLKIAVLPIDNLTGGRAPTRELQGKLEAALTRPGIGVGIVGGEALQHFLVERRLRQSGAVDRDSAKAAAEMLGVDALLVTSLTLYRETEPPRLGLSMRLVRAADDAAILWADGASAAGDEAPGLLDLQRIEALGPLEDQVFGRLTRSLASFALGAEPAPAQDCGANSTFGAKVQFRSALLDSNEPLSLAVVPFLNATRQRHAGDVVAAEFVRELASRGPFRVIEPGVVRDLLLRFRMVMPGGVNLEATRELLGALEADLVLSGSVLEFDEQGGEGPRVRFSTTLLDSHTGKVLWQSTSMSQGTDGVLLFDFGQVHTVSALTCQMVGSVVRGFAAKGTANAPLARPDWWHVSRVSHLPPTARGPVADCAAPLPAAAMEVDPREVQPAFLSRRPGHLGEPVLALRAIQVRFDPKTGTMLPADAEALAQVARCAQAQGHDLAVRALVAPTPEQLGDGARHTVDALHSIEGLRRERVRLELRSVGDRRGPVEVLVAVVPGASSMVTSAGLPNSAPGDRPAPTGDEGTAEVAAESAGGGPLLTSVQAQSLELAQTKRSAAVVERAGALEDKARRLGELEKELGGAGGKLAVVGPEERELRQLEDRQVEVETRLRTIQATLLANEARRKQEEQAALADAGRLQRSGATPLERGAAQVQAQRARDRRLEASTDRVALQERLLAAIEKRLEAQEKRLELAGEPGTPLQPGEPGKRQLAAALEEVRPELRRCVAAALKQPTAPARAVGAATLIIDGRGRVSRVLVPAAWRGTGLEACLTSAAGSWHFPSSGGEYQLQDLLTSRE